MCALDPGTADCASPTLSCVADRVVASTARAATMGWYSWSLDPSNEYLKYHATPAWEALRTLQACSDEVLDAAAAAAAARGTDEGAAGL